MLTVTASLSQVFESQLSLRNILDQQRRDFHRDLGFIWIFAQSTLRTRSLPLVLPGLTNKLQSKGQSDAQRMDARHLLPNDRHPSIAADIVRQFYRYKC